MVNDGGVCLCVVLCYVLIKQLPFSSKVIYFVHQRSAEQIMHAMNQEREREKVMAKENTDNSGLAPNECCSDV